MTTNLPESINWSSYLDQITEVHYSDWTGDYFIHPPLPGDIFHLAKDWPPDAKLYKAITAMIATWEQENDESNSSVIYRRLKCQ